MLNKITLILFKYLPACFIVGILINNLLYFYIGTHPNAHQITWILPYYIDGVSGQSILVLTLFFFISLKFNYCAWHRILLTGCLLSIATVFLDAFHAVSTSNLDLYTIIISVSCVACFVATAIHIYNTRQGHWTCFSRHTMSPRFDSFLIGFIKWFPFIQLFSLLLSNLIATLDCDIRMCYVLDFSTGNSLLASLFLFFLSKRLNFPYWHRLFIIANFINLSIAFCDANILTLSVSDWHVHTDYIV